MEETNKLVDTLNTEQSFINLGPINIMVYLSDECGKHFSKAQDLGHHLIRKHASTLHEKQHAQKYFQCEHCNTTVKSRKSLKRHVQEQHVAERFSCLHCNYKTNRKYQLNELKKTHNVNPSTTRISKQPRQKSNKLLEPETHLASMVIADNMFVEQQEMDEELRSQDEKEMLEDSLTVLKIYKLLKRMTNR